MTNNSAPSYIHRPAYLSGFAYTLLGVNAVITWTKSLKVRARPRASKRPSRFAQYNDVAWRVCAGVRGA